MTPARGSCTIDAALAEAVADPSAEVLLHLWDGLRAQAALIAAQAREIEHLKLRADAQERALRGLRNGGRACVG